MTWLSYGALISTAIVPQCLAAPGQEGPLQNCSFCLGVLAQNVAPVVPPPCVLSSCVIAGELVRVAPASSPEPRRYTSKLLPCTGGAGRLAVNGAVLFPFAYAC